MGNRFGLRASVFNSLSDSPADVCGRSASGKSKRTFRLMVVKDQKKIKKSECESSAVHTSSLLKKNSGGFTLSGLASFINFPKKFLFIAENQRGCRKQQGGREKARTGRNQHW